jgi:carotenoid cleavage dioxygenase-like enzyme
LINSEKKIINKINGFYGVIGPDIDMMKTTNIYDLFTSNGIIQGIFFNQGNITFVKNYIRTNKILFEEQYGEVPNNKFLKLFFEIFSKIKLLPSLLDVSNTALIKINNYTYSLYERDLPYKLDINIEKNEINTIGKININNINHFSAHSKMYNNNIETIEYNLFTNSINYLLLDNKFKIIKKKKINTQYLPIIHDFYILENKIFFLDSPLVMDYHNIINTNMPIKLDTKKETIINILDKNNMKLEKYYLNNSIFMFHFANIEENNTHYNIYASTYDNIDFNKFDLDGKYRQIVINKENKKVELIKNKELEKLNLDFPLVFNNYTLLRKIKNNINDGFVICDKMKIIKIIEFTNKNICGEPTIIKIDNTLYLLFFIFDIYNKNKSKINLMNLENYKLIEISLDQELNCGFHSIFINN